MREIRIPPGCSIGVPRQSAAQPHHYITALETGDTTSRLLDITVRGSRFDRLFGNFPALTKLVMNITNLQFLRTDMNSGPYASESILSHATSNPSFENLMRMLHAIALTLETLEINFVDDDMHFITLVSPLTTMKEFTKLRHLKIPFEAFPSWENKPDPALQLPPSVEKLVLTYPSASALTWLSDGAKLRYMLRNLSEICLVSYPTRGAMPAYWKIHGPPVWAELEKVGIAVRVQYVCGTPDEDQLFQ